MAASPFPQRKSQGAGGSSDPGGSSGSVLDQPPPSPMQPTQGGMTPGVAQSPGQGMPGFEEMAQPFTAGSPGRATSPEVVMGLMSSAETIYGMLDSMASIVPDLANDLVLQKDLLQRTMAKLLVKGGTAGMSQSTGGAGFPGGGFDRGF